MKRIREKVKTVWWDLWGIYENGGDSIQHLSWSDKINIWFGSFIMCIVAVGICFFILGINNIRNSRHDLVFSEYSEDIESLIRYIPNTSENCPTCRESYPAQAFLICVNTGELYSLDLYHKDENPDEETKGMCLSFGYDEISKTGIQVTKQKETKNGFAEIDRGEKIISAQKMKAVFCDDCIRKILDIIEGMPLEEVVLFDAKEKNFYSIEDGEILQIGNYGLAVSYDSGDFRIDIEYVSE